MCNKCPRGKYVLLGDDIVITDDQIAEKYLEVMETLDVPISKEKTHVSKTTCEFAKRWMHKGVEITPFPLHAVKETWKRYFMLSGTFKLAWERGFRVQEGSCEEMP